MFKSRHKNGATRSPPAVGASVALCDVTQWPSGDDHWAHFLKTCASGQTEDKDGLPPHFPLMGRALHVCCSQSADACICLQGYTQTLILENLNDRNNAWTHPIIAMAPMVNASNIYVIFFFWLKMNELMQLRSLPRCNNSGLEVRGVNLMFLPIVAAAAPIQTSSVSPSLVGSNSLRWGLPPEDAHIPDTSGNTLARKLLCFSFCFVLRVTSP